MTDQTEIPKGDVLREWKEQRILLDDYFGEEGEC